MSADTAAPWKPQPEPARTRCERGMDTVGEPAVPGASAHAPA